MTSEEVTLEEVPLSGGTLDNSELAYTHYLNRGLPPHVAAGIVGNLIQESNLNPHVKGDEGKATGIAQWHPDRFNTLRKWAASQGRNPYDLRTQLDFVIEEPGEGERALKKLFETTNPQQAAVVFSNTYERPNKKYAANNKRAAYAQSLMSRYGNNNQR